MRPSDLNRLGVSRTFQLLQVFPKLSVRENLILAGQEHQGTCCRGCSGRAMRASSAGGRSDDRASSSSAISPASGPAGLSYGQQKLLDAAMAFMAGPRLVLLDEPAGGVNLTMLGDLKARLAAINAEQGATFVVIEHNMEFVMSLCSRVMVLAEGKVLARARPPRSAPTSAVIDAYLGH